MLLTGRLFSLNSIFGLVEIIIHLCKKNHAAQLSAAGKRY